eukprot:11135510-Heterocapsa_arctica.AAC.1
MAQVRAIAIGDGGYALGVVLHACKGRSTPSIAERASCRGKPSLCKQRCKEIVSLLAVEIAVDV